MSLARVLLPFGFVCASLAGQETIPKPVEKRSEPKVEPPAPAEASSENREGEPRHRRCRHRPSRRHHAFGAYVQGVMPLRELGDDLEQRTGYGLGLQWTHDHGEWHGSRTRLEWNTFPEGGAGTYAKNYLLSWDHLFKLNKGGSHAYLVAGLGGSRWYFEETTAGLRNAVWTTKLAVAAGAGIQVAERVNLEARYVVSGIHRSFDANTLQVSLGWRFE